TSQGSGKFWSAGLVFHDGGRRFRVSQNFALRINHCSPGACGLPLLRHNFLEVVLPVGVNPVREHYSFLTKIALYFLAKRSFPRAANGKIKGCGGRGNNEHEGSQQLEENPIPHFGASIDLNIADLHRRLRQWPLKTSQHRLYPSDQLARTERLRNVIVRAQLQTQYAVGLSALGGEKHDRSRRKRGYVTNLPAELKSIFSRHHDIQNE